MAVHGPGKEDESLLQREKAAGRQADQSQGPRPPAPAPQRKAAEQGQRHRAQEQRRRNQDKGAGIRREEKAFNTP